jgi:short-subunit dehydrogenase
MGNGKLAIVTGASTGIGFELAHIAAKEGHDLLVVADEPLVDAAAGDIRQYGTQVTSIEVDLSTIEGNDRLLAAANGRPIELLLANAGRGLGRAFLDQDVDDWRHVIETNVTGTTYLLQ